MAVEREGGRVVFFCDFCADTLNTEEVDFIDAVDVMRAAGWSTLRFDGGGERGSDWLNRCPDCQAQYRQLTHVRGQRGRLQ